MSQPGHDRGKIIIEFAASKPHSGVSAVIYQMTDCSLKHVTSILVGCFRLVTLNFLNHADLVIDLRNPRPKKW